jgi:hypothetical protein
VCSNETHWGIVTEEKSTIKNSPYGHWGKHLIDTPADGSPSLIIFGVAAKVTAPLCHDIFIQPESVVFQCVTEEAEYMEITQWQLWALWGMVHHLPGHGAQCILGSSGHRGMGIVTQHDTPHLRVFPYTVCILPWISAGWQPSAARNWKTSHPCCLNRSYT